MPARHHKLSQWEMLTSRAVINQSAQIQIEIRIMPNIENVQWFPLQITPFTDAAQLIVRQQKSSDGVGNQT